MIYDSIEIIPAKIYFKIVETGNVSLLTNEKISNDELQSIWSKLEKEHNKIGFNKDINKVLDLSKKMEYLSAKYEAIRFSIYYLKHEVDTDLVDMLKSYGYKFTDDFESDLRRIDLRSEAIIVKIKRVEKQLPKVDSENASKSTSFDEVVLSYSSLVGSGFIDTNKITLTQYYALLNVGNQKIKSLENAR